MKIAVITCYHDPDYVRARTIRAALKNVPGVKMVVIKNTHKGALRYPQVLWRIWKTKRTDKPDAFVLTFRGQELLPFVLLLAGKTPLIFDEFIIPIAYANGSEKHKKSIKIRVFYALARMSEPLYKSWLRSCRLILADTSAHAELSARTSNMNLSKYISLPVGTDESVFKLPTKNYKTPGTFTVFYYSTGMQPLHGIEYVLEAAELLKDDPSIEFLLIGGKKAMQDAVKASYERGAHVTHERWMPFNNLLSTMYTSGLCMGGPFGDTNQAQHVITGKTFQMLAAGAPTLIGANEATRQYFVDKENALVIPQSNPVAIKNAIVWAKKNPDEIKRIAANGRKVYDKNFSTTALTKIWQSIVSDLQA
ncbi:glycosyltransferase [Aeromicrobium sp.]|nr:glycosyltransferase [Candidatus Saccharibacteria bacterium]